MSELVRFSTGSDKIKARIFERGSRKMACIVCKIRRFSLLIRFIEPEKKEVGICHECLVKMALGHNPFPVPLCKCKLKPKKRRKKTAKKKIAKKKRSLTISEGQKDGEK